MCEQERAGQGCSMSEWIALGGYVPGGRSRRGPFRPPRTRQCCAPERSGSPGAVCVTAAYRCSGVGDVDDEAPVTETGPARLSAADVDRELNAIHAWVNDWMDGDRVRDGWQAAPGSPLAGDDRRTFPHQTSHTAHAAINVALDHLQALTFVTAEHHTLHLNAPYSLARAAIENAAIAYWLVSPARRQEPGSCAHFDCTPRTFETRLTRRPTWARRHWLASALAWRNSKPWPPPRALLKTGKGWPKFTSTEAVTAVDRALDNGIKPGALGAWRLFSGMVHARPWATAAFLDREVTPSTAASRRSGESTHRREYCSVPPWLRMYSRSQRAPTTNERAPRTRQADVWMAAPERIRRSGPGRTPASARPARRCTLSVEPSSLFDMHDPTAPDVYAPPRQVFEWTVVPGHEVRLLRRAAGGALVGVCSCGERESDASQGWRAEHLQGAWPILVIREAHESIESWHERLLTVLAAARAEDERLSEDLAMRMGVEPGKSYPVVTETDVAASQRVEVLEHQLAGPPFKNLA